MAPETIDLIKYGLNTVFSSALTTGIIKYRSRHSSQQARNAANTSAEALKTAADAARAVTEALRLATDAGRSAMAAHKRIDGYEHRLTVLEVQAAGTQRELYASITRIETLVRDSIKRVEDMASGLANRIDKLADRAL